MTLHVWGLDYLVLNIYHLTEIVLNVCKIGMVLVLNPKVNCPLLKTNDPCLCSAPFCFSLNCILPKIDLNSTHIGILG